MVVLKKFGVEGQSVSKFLLAVSDLRKTTEILDLKDATVLLDVIRTLPMYSEILIDASILQHVRACCAYLHAVKSCGSKVAFLGVRPSSLNKIIHLGMASAPPKAAGGRDTVHACSVAFFVSVRF
ncbi:hypothetical protein HPP92_029112 [Vanilla planifolia]|uniref:Uncharacterized protein n=1 Tax=Vanilla planifolia TaxID=51239 RepID=A0A835U306_VANPL|nr:hypothetical protein HPP92_029112 [Vanilla planifolia]KAG0445900.1 hypothetical protein HPP92_029101 [Vanilla planifolia]